MASNGLRANRFVSPGPGGCIPILGALIAALFRLVLGRRSSDEDDENDDRA